MARIQKGENINSYTLSKLSSIFYDTFEISLNKKITSLRLKNFYSLNSIYNDKRLNEGIISTL